MPGSPKPGFYIAVLLVVGAFVGFAFYRMSSKKTGDDATANGGSAKKIDIKDIRGSDVTSAEGSDSSTPTTVNEYTFDPSTRLPAITGAGDYKKLGTPRVVRFDVNVWAGWAPIIWANKGNTAKPGIWKDSKGQEFQVELVLIDDPIAMGDTVASGDVHIGWATVDMLPLVIERLHRDPRGMPRVFQQIDWSNGGDGIVARDNIKNINDLKGKTVVLSKYSPSHYFLLNMLLESGLQPTDVDMRFTKTAFEAAAAFNSDKSFVGAVSWSPDIYNLTDPKKVKGNRMLISTQTANKLIADVWFARADFAKENPEIIEGLVRGILNAVDELQDKDKQKQVGALMEKFYNLPDGTGEAMLGDAHWANYAENKDFFLNQNNPTNFERTYGTAYRLYRAIPGSPLTVNVAFDQIMDFSVIKRLESEPKYAAQKNEYEYHFTPVAADAINVEDAVLTKTVTISFPPNKWELHEQMKDAGGKPLVDAGGKPVLYDMQVDRTIEDIAKLAGEFGAARIQISGHTDASMRGRVDEELVRELSQHRADSVKQELVNKFKLDQKQFVTVGYGWSKPADPKDPDNSVKNRRVEIKVVPAEGG